MTYPADFFSTVLAIHTVLSFYVTFSHTILMKLVTVYIHMFYFCNLFMNVLTVIFSDICAEHIMYWISMHYVAIAKKPLPVTKISI